MIENKLSRFQADLDPISGSVSIQGFWQKVSLFDSDNVVGAMAMCLNQQYDSLANADASALANTEFVQLAASFQDAPFTTFVALLEKLKESVEVMGDGERT